VAVVGLAVNVLSAWILQDSHHAHDHAGPHTHHHHDHNLRAAYLHVMADALTSVLAIVALLAGATPAAATTLVPMTLPELTDAAHSVVLARAGAPSVQEVFEVGTSGRGETRIETVIPLDVLARYKGPDGSGTRAVVTGGTMAGVTMVSSGAPTLEPGETALLFLDEEGRIVGGPQGKRPPSDANRPVHATVLQAPDAGSIEAPAIAANAISTQEDVVVFAEDFESGMGQWEVHAVGSPHKWDTTTHRSSGGSSSAYCAQDSVGAPGPYDSDMQAWMKIGPFDLSEATSATLEFDAWVDTEIDYDILYYGLSTDDATFPLDGWSGDQGGWFHQSTPLDAAPDGDGGTMSYLGEPEVWVAFIFTSDEDTVEEGAYIDDVRITIGGVTTPAITSIDPPSGSAGTGTLVTIRGGPFGHSQGTGHVDFYYDGVDTIRAPVVSWTNASIVCEVPIDWIDEYPAAASTGPVTVTRDDDVLVAGQDFTVDFAYGGFKWSDPHVGFRTNPNCPDTVDEAMMVQAAAETWGPASVFELDYLGPSSSTTFQEDGANDMFWSDSILPPGVASQAFLWVIGEDIVEINTIFNDDYDWGDGTGGTYDVESVALHEFGHWLNLRDLYGADSHKVMYGWRAEDDAMRSLAPEDAAGVKWVYPFEVVRIAGADRYATAAAIASEHFASVDVTTVVVATGASFADALSASGLCGAYDAPLLLVRPGSVPGSVATLLASYTNLERIFVVGGTGAVSSGVEQALGAYAPTTRLAGISRYGTAAEVAEAIASKAGDSFSAFAFVARGDSFADALAASPFAYDTSSPVLLTRTGALPAETADAIGELGIDDAVVLGGQGAVSSAVKASVDTVLAANGGGPSDRWAGLDRYATAALIAESGVARWGGSFAFVSVATGVDFPDALGGGVGSGAESGPILLTRPTSLSQASADSIDASEPDLRTIHVLGGASAVSDAVIDDIEGLAH
jgi:putative cell wall-binding protein